MKETKAKENKKDSDNYKGSTFAAYYGYVLITGRTKKELAEKLAEARRNRG